MAILRDSRPVVGDPVASASLTRRALTALTDWELLLAPVGVVLLLLYPHPLSVPGGLLGVLPTTARWKLRGQPWRRTPFDVPLALLVVGALVGYAVALDSTNAPVRLAGFLAGLILFAWLREQLTTLRHLLVVKVVVLCI